MHPKRHAHACGAGGEGNREGERHKGRKVGPRPNEMPQRHVPLPTYFSPGPAIGQSLSVFDGDRDLKTHTPLSALLLSCR